MGNRKELWSREGYNPPPKKRIDRPDPPPLYHNDTVTVHRKYISGLKEQIKELQDENEDTTRTTEVLKLRKQIRQLRLENVKLKASSKLPSFDEVDAKINDVCALMGSDDVELVYVTIKELGNFA